MGEGVTLDATVALMAEHSSANGDKASPGTERRSPIPWCSDCFSQWPYDWSACLYSAGSVLDRSVECLGHKAPVFVVNPMAETKNSIHWTGARNMMQEPIADPR